MYREHPTVFMGIVQVLATGNKGNRHPAVLITPDTAYSKQYGHDPMT